MKRHGRLPLRLLVFSLWVARQRDRLSPSVALGKRSEIVPAPPSPQAHDMLLLPVTAGVAAAAEACCCPPSGIE